MTLVGILGWRSAILAAEPPAPPSPTSPSARTLADLSFRLTPFPVTGFRDFGGHGSTGVTTPRFETGDAMVASTSFRGETLRGLSSPGLSERLIAGMQREARRYRFESLHAGGVIPDIDDSSIEEQRARQAQRIISRGFKRTLDDRLEEVARGTPGLAQVLQSLDNLVRFRAGTGGARAPEAGPCGAGGGATGNCGARADRPPGASLGLKLDAHPRIILSARFLGTTGRIEVPILDRSVRLAFDHALGARGRAVLAGGWSPEGQDWATLNFGLRF